MLKHHFVSLQTALGQNGTRKRPAWGKMHYIKTPFWCGNIQAVIGAKMVLGVSNEHFSRSAESAQKAK
jgi:hypothetical protein